MYNNQYHDAIALPDYDQKITDWLKKQRGAGGGREMVVAIESAAGAVYRTITASGMADYMNLCLALESLGLKNRFKDRAGDGRYDDRFYP